MVAALLVAFALSLAAGIPVALSMGIASLAAILVDGMLPLEVIPQTLFTGISSFPMLAIPFFILAADLMTAGKMTETLIRFSNDLLGHIRGALGHVNVLVSVLFGGMSGSALADAAGPGAIILRMMRSSGYEPYYSGGLTAITATLGAIIPPSIPMVIYALSDGRATVAGLFVAGIVPGLLMATALMAINHWFAIKKGYGAAGRWPGWRTVTRSFTKALPALFMPVLIVVGIRGGVMTATEASAVAVAYALVVGLIQRNLRWRDVPRILLRSGLATSGVLLLVSMGSAFAWLLAYGQVPQQFAAWIGGITQNPTAVLGLIFLLAFVTGMFVDTLPSILILVPVLSPLAAHVGIDPIHMGIVFVLSIVAGMVTPPVAPLLFVVSSVGRLRFERLSVAVLPLLLTYLIVIWLLILFPPLVTGLPHLLGYVR